MEAILLILGPVSVMGTDLHHCISIIIEINELLKFRSSLFKEMKQLSNKKHFLD